MKTMISQILDLNFKEVLIIKSNNYRSNPLMKILVSKDEKYVIKLTPMVYF